MRKQVVKKQGNRIIWKKLEIRVCSLQRVFNSGDGKYVVSNVKKELASHVFWMNKYPQDASFVFCATPVVRAAMIRVGVRTVAEVTPTYNYLYPSDMHEYSEKLYPELIKTLGVHKLHYVLVSKVD